MFKEFNRLSIHTIAAEKRLDLLFNFDIKPESVKGDSIILSRVRDDFHIPFKLVVKNDLISLQLDDWPDSNEPYFVIVNAAITNIVGRHLQSTVKRKITFKSEIVSKVVVTNPHNFETIQDLSFKLEEKDGDVNRYYIEIAKENRFYNTVYTSHIDKKEFDLHIVPDLMPGQYYIRARAEYDEEYGPWSPIVTFCYKEEPNPELPMEPVGGNAEMPSPWDDMYDSKTELLDGIKEEEPAIEIISDLELLTYPENGVTPEKNQLIFEFDHPIDEDLIQSIILIRKDF